MSARAAMTHRCSILRDQGTMDEFSAETTPDWEPVAQGVACRCYYTGGRLQADASQTNPLGSLMILLPLGTDVTGDDRIGDVTDRMGQVLFSGPFTITGAVGHRQDHLAVAIREV